MSTIDKLAAEFLSQKFIAVAGVSEKRETPANNIYKILRARGTTVFAINPHDSSFHGEPCYPSLVGLPVTPDVAIIVTNPATAEELVRQCGTAGIRRVWLHNMLGTRPRFFKKAGAKMTSVPANVVELCRQLGITVIPGSCPMQFIGDPGHACMRGLLRFTGALEMPA